MPAVRLVQTRAERTAIDSSDPAAVDRLVEEWPDAYLACRAGNHHWKGVSVDNYRAFMLITERCMSCKSIREWDMGVGDSLGQRLGPRRIRYSEGYLAAGVGRIGDQGRNKIRYASVMRTMPKPRVAKDLDNVVLHKATREALGLAEAS